MRPTFYINAGKKRYSSFSLFATIGGVATILLAFFLAHVKMLDMHEVLAVVLHSFINVVAFYALHYVITGSKKLTYYRYQIFIIAGNCLFIYAFNLGNGLALIDLTVICIGAFQCVGRIGCFHAGCCHGRPCRYGVVYNHEVYKKHGFPPAYLGTKLLPVQLISAGYIFFLVATATGIFLSSQSAAGSATVYYITGYALCRFTTEFFRGDTDRKYIGLLSEAQITAFVSSILVLVLQFADVLPFHTYCIVVNILLLINVTFLFLISFQRQSPMTGLIFRPEASIELFRCLNALKEDKEWGESFDPRNPIVIKTSLGVSLSMQQLSSEKMSFLYTVSCFTNRLNASVLRFFLYLIALQREKNARHKLVNQSDHIAHILFE